jgi:hypothetical protein
LIKGSKVERRAALFRGAIHSSKKEVLVLK